jgi:IS4 transposase
MSLIRLVRSSSETAYTSLMSNEIRAALSEVMALQIESVGTDAIFLHHISSRRSGTSLSYKRNRKKLNDYYFAIFNLSLYLLLINCFDIVLILYQNSTLEDAADSSMQFILSVSKQLFIISQSKFLIALLTMTCIIP